MDDGAGDARGGACCSDAAAASRPPVAVGSGGGTHAMAGGTMNAPNLEIRGQFDDRIFFFLKTQTKVGFSWFGNMPPLVVAARKISPPSRHRSFDLNGEWMTKLRVKSIPSCRDEIS